MVVYPIICRNQFNHPFGGAGFRNHPQYYLKVNLVGRRGRRGRRGLTLGQRVPGWHDFGDRISLKIEETPG